MTYNPAYITGEPQFRQPTPSEKDKIRSFLTYGMIFFFVAAMVFIIAGAYNLVTYSVLSALSTEDLKDYLGSAYINATRAEMDLVLLLQFLLAGVILVIWGIVALLIAFLTRSKAIVPLDKGEYEESGRFLRGFMVLGFIFGLVIAGIMLFKARDLLKRTAVRMDAGAIATSTTPMPGASGSGEFRRCQICNSMMTFNAQTRMWFCTQCNRYQM